MKIINPTPVLWTYECPYCKHEDEIEYGVFLSQKEVIINCDKCHKKFKLEIDTTKI